MKGVIYSNLADRNAIGYIKFCDICGSFCLVPKDNENTCPCGCDGNLLWAGEKNESVYFTECTINDLHRLGYLVLMNGSTIEYEDNETGVLHDLEIYDFGGDILYCCERGVNGKIVSEWEIPLSVYISQLDSCGALAAYDKVVNVVS